MTETHRTDLTGANIKSGNIIAYPQRQGSSLWMNLAMVVNFGTKRTGLPLPFIRVLKIPTQRWNDKPGDQFKRKPRTSVIYNIENVVVVRQSASQLDLDPEIQKEFENYVNRYFQTRFATLSAGFSK